MHRLIKDKIQDRIDVVMRWVLGATMSNATLKLQVDSFNDVDLKRGGGAVHLVSIRKSEWRNPLDKLITLPSHLSLAKGLWFPNFISFCLGCYWDADRLVSSSHLLPRTIVFCASIKVSRQGNAVHCRKSWQPNRQNIGRHTVVSLHLEDAISTVGTKQPYATHENIETSKRWKQMFDARENRISSGFRFLAI